MFHPPSQKKTVCFFVRLLTRTSMKLLQVLILMGIINCLNAAHPDSVLVLSHGNIPFFFLSQLPSFVSNICVSVLGTSRIKCVHVRDSGMALSAGGMCNGGEGVQCV